MTVHPKIQPASEQERKLLPCPFCGGDEISHGYEAPPYRGVAQCHSCEAFIMAEDEPAVIAAWNRRTPLSASEQGEPVSVSHPSDWTLETWQIDDWYFQPPRKSTLPTENDVSDFDGSSWVLP